MYFQQQQKASNQGPFQRIKLQHGGDKYSQSFSVVFFLLSFFYLIFFFVSLALCIHLNIIIISHPQQNAINEDVAREIEWTSYT